MPSASFSKKTKKNSKKLKKKEDESLSTPELVEDPKSLSLKTKSNIYGVSTQITRSSEILDQDSIIQEKVLKPFWNQQSVEISKKLLLPTVTGSLGSASDLSNNFSKGYQTPKSWYTIDFKNLRLPPNKNSVKISSPLSQSMQLGYTVSEAISRPENPEKLFKTLSARLFPSKNIGEKQKISEYTQIQTDMGIMRWYCNFVRDFLSTSYNHFVDSKIELEREFGIHIPDILNKYKVDKGTHLPKILVDQRNKEIDEIKRKGIKVKKSSEYKKKWMELKEKEVFCKLQGRGGKLSNISVRDVMRYVTVEDGTQKPYYDPHILNPAFYIPPKFRSIQVNQRVIRGAIKLMTANFQSTLSNCFAGNTKKFTFDRKLTKKNFNILYFEDSSLPAYIRKIETKRRSDKPVQWERGCTIKFNPRGKIYTLYYVEECEKKKNKKENGKVKLDQDIVSSIDEGIVNTHCIYTHDPVRRKCIIELHKCSSSKKIERLLKKIDSIKSCIDSQKLTPSKTERLRNGLLKANKAIHNSVLDMNKKLASRLAKNNDHIFLGDFPVSQIAKRTNLRSNDKRFLYLWQFHHFKTFLEFKCSENGTNLYIVGEEYTSKTCGNCGSLNCSPHSSERLHKCKDCDAVYDRDIGGARNILIKGLS